MELSGYIASLIMGAILGLLGGGGSILTVPILVYLFDIPPATATGYSLFIVGVTALLGSFSYLKQDEVNLSIGVTFAFPSMSGVVLSRTVLVPSLPDMIISFGPLVLTKDVLIMVAFACLMMLASWSMIYRKNGQKPAHPEPPFRFAKIMVQGFFVGLVAGFVGAGGGFLIVPALTLLAGLTMRVAVGTSLIVIAVQSLLGFVGDLTVNSDVNWSLLFAVSAIASLGILIGARMNTRVPELKLKKAFGWFVLIMGTGVLIEQLRNLT